jgi:uncharacterized protein YeaO (DUF488 family)
MFVGRGSSKGWQMLTRKKKTSARRPTGTAAKRPRGPAETAPRVEIKRVYAPAAAADGRRVLVDRLWPRGIAKAAIAEWRPDLAPSNELRRWYGHAPARFDEFAKRYRTELAGAGEAIAALRDAAGERPLTLLTATRELALSHLEVLRRLIVGSAPRRPRRAPRARSPRR